MKIILTGGSGMVGRGVLLEALEDTKVTEIVSLVRNPTGEVHAKLKERVLKDFSNLNSVREDLKGADACIFAAGVSAAGKTEEEYNAITHDLTLDFAAALLKICPDIRFLFVSGAGTDSTEKSRMMWARVKGRTENHLLRMGFSSAIMLRPGMILPRKGIRSRTGFYNALYVLLRPFDFLLEKMDSVTTTTRLGRAFLKLAGEGSEKSVLEAAELNRIGKSAI